MRRRIKKYRWIKPIWYTMVIILIFFTIAVICMDCKIIPIQLKCYNYMTCMIGKFFFSDSHVVDGFGILWGITVSILLFFLGFYNSYWYGIRLKKLVNLSVANGSIWVMGILFIVYCPLVYIAEALKRYTTALLGIIGTFLIFVTVVVFLIFVTKREWISLVLKKSTVCQLKKLSKSREFIWKIRECFLGGYNKKVYKEEMGVKAKIESLPITEMIAHLDYENEDEIEHMLDILFDITVKTAKKIENTVYEYVVFLSWMTKIMEKSGVSEKVEQERTAYIAKRLWVRIADSNRQEVKRLYLLEILISTLESKYVFKSMWQIIGDYRSQTLLYLYLYMEYLSVLELEEHGLEDLFFVNYEFLREECVLWDFDLAWRLWLSWCAFWNHENDIAVSSFYCFCEDVRAISENKVLKVRTRTMKRILMRVGKLNATY